MFFELPNNVIVGITVINGTVGVYGMWEGYQYSEGGFYFKRPVKDASVKIDDLLMALEGAAVAYGIDDGGSGTGGVGELV